jgi:DNA repair exonuclease SbcCD ATPase subunit
MRPTHLKIQNYKNHTLSEFCLSDGLSLITGPIGRGKSSILEAIEVALFGATVVTGKVQHLITQGAKSFKIELTLDSGHVITRTNKDASITLNGELVVNGTTAVTEHVEEMLNIDRKSFHLINVSAQGEPQRFLEMGGAELTKFIESLTGADQIDLLLTLVRQKIGELKRQLDSQGASTLNDEDVTALKDRLTSVEGELLEAMLTTNDIDQKIFNLKESGKAKSEVMKQISEQYAEYKYYVETSTPLLAKQEVLVEQLKNLSFNETSFLEEQIKSLKADIRAADAAVKAYKMYKFKVESAKADLAAAETKYSQLVKPVVSTDLDDATKIYNKQKQDYSMKSLEIQTFEKAIKESYCHECLRPFDDLGVHKSELSAKLEIAKAEAENLKKKLSLAEHDLSVATREAQAYAKWSQDSEAAMMRISERQDVLTAIEVVPEPVEGVDELKSAQLTELESRLSLYKVKNKQYDEATAALESVREKLASLIPREKPELTPTDLLEELSQLKAEMHELQLQEKDLNHAIFELTLTKKSILTDIERNVALIAACKELGKAISAYTELLTILTDGRIEYCGLVWEQILSVASDFTSICTGGEISKINLSEDGLTYVLNGEELPKTGASGGQKAIIGLGLKLGILQISMSNFDSLLLDEISAALDEASSLTVLNQLSHYAPQILCVSHRQFDCGAERIEL